MFEGITVALVTPFRNGEVDLEALDRLVDHVLAGGVDGLVPLGSTGEGAVLTEEEREAVVGRVRERAGSKVFILPGTGTSSTALTIQRTRQAKELGADAALISAPPYNKPTPDGLLAHFRAVADAVDLPIVLYNVPGRTAVAMDVPTIVSLAEHPRIVAIKESSGSLDQTSNLVRADCLTVLSGDDNITLPMLAIGARGVVSVAGNIFPGAMVSMVRSAMEGDFTRARAFHLALMPLFKGLFIESNPLPAKRALTTMGILEEEMRLPLVPMRRENAEKLDAIVAKVRRDLEQVEREVR